MVEAAHDFRGLFDHRLLILAGGYRIGTERGDISRLRNGISEETDGNAAFEAAHADFGLHRRVALQATYRHQVLEIESQFTQFRDLALHEKGHLLGVETAGQIVEGDLDYILAYLFGVIGVVSQRLSVGDKHKHLAVIARVLQFYAATERTDEMTDVQATGGTVAGENNLIGRHVIAY